MSKLTKWNVIIHKEDFSGYLFPEGFKTKKKAIEMLDTIESLTKEKGLNYTFELAKY